MTHTTDRRHFLQHAAGISLGGLALPLAAAESKKEPLFHISLAQWSLHRAFFGKKLDPLDFAKIAKKDYGIDAVEYVNQFYKDKANDEKYPPN